VGTAAAPAHPQPLPGPGRGHFCSLPTVCPARSKQVADFIKSYRAQAVAAGVKELASVPLLPPEEQATLPEATLQHLRVSSCSKCAAHSSKPSSQPGELRAARAQPVTCTALSRRALQRRARRARGARARARRGPACAPPAGARRPGRERARLEVLERVLGVVQLGRQGRVGRIGRVAAQEGAMRLQVRAHLLQLLRPPGPRSH